MRLILEDNFRRRLRLHSRLYPMSFGKELVDSAREALAIAGREVEPAGAFVPETVDVAAIRKKLKLSQSAFANQYGLPVGTVRD